MIKHIAFIPDGNRRYAKKNLKTRFEGHSKGSETFRNVLQWCKDANVEEVTFWALSFENLKREEDELAGIFKLINQFCDELIANPEKHNHLKIKFIGERILLPKMVQDKMHKIEELTKNNNPHKLNLLVAYGGRHELTKAMKKIALEIKTGTLSEEMIDESIIGQYLEIKSSPDLIIRTGHACLSGFLPWQSTYSEIVFLEDKLWPEFSKSDFDNCLKKFEERTRNFGK